MIDCLRIPLEKSTFPKAIFSAATLKCLRIRAQLKEDIVNWNKGEPHSVANIQIPHPLYLVVMNTLRNTMIISRNLSQTRRRTSCFCRK
jgi:hypothetical protein